MTTISDITDALAARVAAVLSDYAEIPEGIDIEDNSETYLRRGHAIRIAPNEVIQDTTCDFTIEQREFNIILTQQILTTPSNTVGKRDQKKEMLESVRALKKDLHRDNKTLGGVAIDTMYNGDTGVDEFMEGERNKYYISVMSVLVKFKDDLTT